MISRRNGRARRLFRASKPPGNVIAKPAAFSDKPVADYRRDTLGFTNYVSAVREFLLNRQTETPFCMSVEGDWGSGKSSFLRQLERAISLAGVKTVFFEAWRHNDDESLAASFALECARQLRPTNVIARTYAALKLWIRRADFTSWTALARLFVRLGIFVFLSTALALFLLYGHVPVTNAIATWTPVSKPQNASASHTTHAEKGQNSGAHTPLHKSGAQRQAVAGSFANLTANLNAIKTTWSSSEDLKTNLVSWLIGSGSIAGYIILVMLLFKGVKQLAGDPFDFDLSKLAADPGYKARVGFAEELYRDLSKVIAVYTRGRRFVAFIDDLDRCDAGTVAQLMQAISLVTSLEAGKPVFVIAMDRDLVAGALAVKDKDEIPFLTFQGDEPSPKALMQRGLDYGSAFMEKVIQVSFRVPRPSSYELWDMAVGEKGPLRLERLRELRDADDSRRVLALENAVAFVFAHNPRRIKQFINLFRLNILLATAVRVMDDVNNLDIQEDYNVSNQMPEMRQLTVEKLGKFLALTLAYPRFVKAMSKDRRLLPELQEWALHRSHKCESAVEEWQQDGRLIDLLALNESEFYSSGNIPDAEQRAAIFSLEEIDLHALLRLAPPPGFVPPPLPPPLPHPESKIDLARFEATGAHAMLRKRANYTETLELIAPAKGGGLAHFICRLGLTQGGWAPHKLLMEPKRFDSASLIVSDYVDKSGDKNLELAARSADEQRVAFFWRYADMKSEWRGPYFLPITARGQPLLFQCRKWPALESPYQKMLRKLSWSTQSRDGEAEGNFSLFVQTSKGLSEYIRDNATFQRQWQPPVRDDIFATTNARALAAFEGTDCAGGITVVFWENGAVAFASSVDNKKWSNPATIMTDASAATGAFCTGDTKLARIDVLSLSGGSLRHVVFDPGIESFRENSSALPGTEGAEAIAVASGLDERVDIAVRVGSKLLHFFREGQSPWNGPTDIAYESARSPHRLVRSSAPRLGGAGTIA